MVENLQYLNGRKNLECLHVHSFSQLKRALKYTEVTWKLNTE